MAKVNKFGTFGGVFTPSILTILGVIMYLRLPMIVGTAGLWVTIGIIILAHIISVTTGLSVSSIATDKKVEAGGTYFMISRSLGLPIGGTLGLALFVGLSFSVSLYLIGFAESFLSYWGFETTINSIRLAGTIILLVVTTITFISTSLAIKTQYFIMAAILLSLVSILFGNHAFGVQAVESLGAADTSSKVVPFMLLFGIFFPAVTGFEAGVSMSGDLKDPKRSIPKGSISAIVVGLVVYIGLAAFFALTVDPTLLATDSQVLLKISWIPELVIAGIWGATLSSALGSILGAPRILQATAADKISPRFFSKGVGASNEPRNALLLTFLIAEGGILIGELDVIARIVSIFFITTYGFLNLSCAFEAMTSADFRPSFKTPIWVSLLGSAACFIVMIQLDFVAAVGATTILGALYLFLKRKELTLEGGDTWGGVWSSLVKTALHRLTTSTQHTRNWRPNILMFNGLDQARPFMTNLGYAISGKLGLLSSFELVLSKDHLNKPQRTSETKDKNVFHNVYGCTDIYSGIDELARVYGYAGVEPNTVLMGLSKKSETKDKFIVLMSNLQRYNLNALYLYHSATGKKVDTLTIDIWWSGWGRNLSLALSLTRHLTSSDHWNRAAIRLCIIVNDEIDDTDRITRYVKNVLQQYRANVTLKIINNHIEQQLRQDIIAAESATTDLSIIGIPESSFDNPETIYTFTSQICDQLSSVLFISAANTFEEHTVVRNSKDGESLSVTKNEWVLPDLVESRYVELNDDIKKIDKHGQQLVETLHKKVFVSSFEPESSLYEKIVGLASTTNSALNKITHYDQLYQRRTSIYRAKSYFNKQVALSLETVIASQIKEQAVIIQEGIQWYLDQLNKDSDRFPKSKAIHYSREEFKILPEDGPALIWYKIRKKIFHPFSRKVIVIPIKYREGAAYFFRDMRYHFLGVLLNDVQKSASALREKFSQLMGWIDESFQQILSENSIETQNESITKFISTFKEKAEELPTLIQDLQSLYKGRLQVEYRKNVIFFVHQLEQINFNFFIQKKRRSQKFYEAKKEDLLNFSDAWSDKTTLQLNTIKASVLLFDYYGFVRNDLQHYSEKVWQFFKRDQQQPVTELLGLLAEIEQLPGQEKQPVLPELGYNSVDAMDLLSETSEALLGATAALPEETNLTIQFDKEVEEVTVPFRAIVAHLVETTLTGPLNDDLEDLQEKVKRSNLVINDQGSLAIFTVYNLKDSDEESLRTAELNRAIRSINLEVETLERAFELLVKNIDHLSDELKNALKLHNLTGLSGDFSALVRSRRTRQLQTRANAQFTKIVGSIKNALVSVLYSQTKGILLARKLSATQSLSVNERIMNVVRRSTPNASILQKLPHYYVSLFSGRSSIGDNFWVSRPLEEKSFEQSYQRYITARQGMILILGERNTGKTSLSKKLSESKAGLHKTYHVFPPEDGSVTASDFDAAMQKATKFEGDSFQLFSLLPHNSIVILNDLELWWERSADGLVLVRHIKSLIEQFSGKCLFIANMNPFAFEIVNTAESLDTHCAGIVRCMPFDSLELKKLVITRHKSSGFMLDFGSGNTDRFSELRLARVFNAIFSYSNGNPGVALNAWLVGIQNFSDKVISWRTPTLKDDDVFIEMPAVWGHICLQLLVHKRMSQEKIVRTVQLDQQQILRTLDVLNRIQLIELRGTSVYHLNPNAEFLLINHFRKKEWI